MDANNTVVSTESTEVGIENPGVQGTSNEDKNNEGEDDDTSKISDEYIPEEDVHHTQITSPTE